MKKPDRETGFVRPDASVLPPQAWGNICPDHLKHKHMTKHSADIEASHCKEGHVQSYRCKECGYWHVGHARKKPRRIKVKR